MKKVLLILLSFCVGVRVYAQKVYFIYLQSESSLPFYVKMDEKVMSSSTEGYLILPKLKDSTYSFLIGQPGKQNESRFSITINKADCGFLIKNTDGGVNLFDLQTLALYNPVVAATSANIQTMTREDSFTKLLSKATDDTSVLTVVVQQETKPEVVEKKAEPKAEVAVKMETVPATKDTNTAEVAAVTVITSTTLTQIQTEPANILAVTTPPVESATSTTASTEKEAKPDSSDAVIATTTESVAPVQNQETTVIEEYTRSVVTKRSESSNTEGFGLVFLDSNEDGADTIRILIPNPKKLLPESKDAVPKADNKQFLEFSSESAQSAISVVKDSAAEKSNVAKKPATACASLATDDDFFKIRRDMASKKTDDDMIAQAKKYFKLKCFRSEHIKYLSTLFMSDAGKYQFFDAAFLHVSDPDKFNQLETEIKDSYYANRFKALVAN